MNRFIMAAVAGVLAATTAYAEVTEQDVANDQTITTQVVTNGWVVTFSATARWRL